MTQYFTDAEFTCHGGCGKQGMAPGFILQLTRARERAGVPFVINSGYRCAAHNKRIGGSPTSSHLTGTAVDIAARSNTRRFRILDALLAEGFIRIGIGKTFIHADLDPRKAQKVVWLY